MIPLLSLKPKWMESFRKAGVLTNIEVIADVKVSQSIAERILRESSLTSFEITDISRQS